MLGRCRQHVIESDILVTGGGVVFFILHSPHTFSPETNIFEPENGWLEVGRRHFLLGRLGLVSRANC